MALITSPVFLDDIGLTSSLGPSYSTDVTTLASRAESRLKDWQDARGVYNLSMGIRDYTDLSYIINFFHVAKGRKNEFLMKDWNDYTSAHNPSTAITSTDSELGQGDGVATTFQLSKTYSIPGTTKVETAQITQPVLSSLLLSIGGVASKFSSISASGLGTIANRAGVGGVINSLTPGTTTVIHFTSNTGTAILGESIVMKDVLGMVELNGVRCTVLAASGYWTTLDIDSSGFSAWAGGGRLDYSLPQEGEAVAAGFEFNKAVRFDTDSLNISLSSVNAGTLDIPIIEVKI